MLLEAIAKEIVTTISSWGSSGSMVGPVRNYFCPRACSINKKISPMARLNNVNEGLTQMVEQKPKFVTTYGRYHRPKSLPHVYDISVTARAAKPIRNFN
jgi:hypothetical protein